jgi:hypothetical protein
MIGRDSRPTLLVYRRAGCSICDEADEWLQAALEDRARRGQPVPLVRRVDVDAAAEQDPELRVRYGPLVPVIAVGEAELPLVTSPRQLRTFLDRTLPALV